MVEQQAENKNKDNSSQASVSLLTLFRTLKQELFSTSSTWLHMSQTTLRSEDDKQESRDPKPALSLKQNACKRYKLLK